MSGFCKPTAKNFESLTLDSGYGGAADSCGWSSLSLSHSGGTWGSLAGSAGGRYMDSCDSLDTELPEGSVLEVLDCWPKLPLLEDVPWAEEELQEVLRRRHPGECRQPAPGSLLKKLSKYLSRALVRIGREAQRLSLLTAKCSKHEIQTAAKLVLSWSLSESCMAAAVKALSAYNLNSGDQLNSSKSSQCNLVFSVGRFFRWMVDSRLSSRIHEHAAIYLTACMQNILEELHMKLPDSFLSRGKESLEAIDKALEQMISNDADLWGLFQPYEHLICGRNAYGVPCIPIYLSLYMERYQSGRSIHCQLYNCLDLRNLEQVMLATSVGTIAELSDLVSQAMYYFHQFGAKHPGKGFQLHFKKGPYSWEPEALHGLFYYMRCPHLELENPNTDPPQIKLGSERPYEILPPVVEWIRVCIAQADHRYSLTVDIGDLRQAARLLLPGVDCEPRQLWINSILYPSRGLDTKQAELKLRQNLGFQMLNSGRTDLVNAAAALLGPEGLNALSEQGLTPLMYAASSGDEAMVQVLLTSGADIDIQVPGYSQQCPSVHAETRHWTALTFAVAFGHLSIAQLLLDAGAHIDGCVGEGSCSETPLQMAAAAGHLDLVSLLLEKGADLLAGSIGKNGVTASLQGITNPFSQAAAHGHRDVLQKLLSQPDTVKNDIMSLEDILAEGAEVSDQQAAKPGVNRSSKSRRKALQDALNQSAEHNYLDITVELHNHGVPWTVHSWLKSLATSLIQRQWTITLYLLKDFDSVKDVYSQEMITQGLTLMFDIFRLSKNDAIMRQLAAIFSHCYGPYPIPMIQESSEKIKAAPNPTLLNCREQSDITFLVEGKPFYGHRAVLSAASSRFKKLIAAYHPDVKTCNPIEIKDIQYNTFKCMAQYIYDGGTERLGISKNQALEVLSASSIFKLNPLTRHCEVICSRNLTPVNSPHMYQRAKVLKANELIAYCNGYFLKNMLPLLEQDSFQQLLQSQAGKNHSLLTELQQVLAFRMQAVYQPTGKETMV
ncbi:ankyrin repeat and BTB/POZ domain-containing protein BTBD11-like [Rhincodon typus]|uniref:ankyrin repeat and BTB/POZ domain-containing protein BTBD11-like n=1 Tax=Rhincodon typus TaxID=259920 RepID=UPI00202EB7DF|nr:ankyrin repeat and BTB/POZ domain-containing protein BTBD11-like [Rhincodon typus]